MKIPRYEKELSLFADEINIYKENPKELTKQLLKLIS